MRSFEELVTEAVAADVTGWGFGWLQGRATEERPPWGYAKLLAEVPSFPPRMVATEAWPANARRAREVLVPRGVQVVENLEQIPDESFELVTARHPVRPEWEVPNGVLRRGCGGLDAS